MKKTVWDFQTPFSMKLGDRYNLQTSKYLRTARGSRDWPEKCLGGRKEEKHREKRGRSAGQSQAQGRHYVTVKSTP